MSKYTSDIVRGIEGIIAYKLNPTRDLLPEGGKPGVSKYAQDGITVSMYSRPRNGDGR